MWCILRISALEIKLSGKALNGKKIKGIRPNLISDETFKLLDELRGFRHVFRHAYAYELDAERIIKLSAKSIKLKGLFLKNITAFKNKLKHDMSR